jgi:hypothetical protein
MPILENEKSHLTQYPIEKKQIWLKNMRMVKNKKTIEFRQDTSHLMDEV